MQVWKRFAAALAALAFGATAFAQGNAPAETNRAANLYVGGGWGQSHWSPGCPGSVPSCDDVDQSVHVFAGYHLTPIFAAELAYTNLGKTTGPNVEVHGKAWEASALAAWPVMNRVSVYGRL